MKHGFTILVVTILAMSSCNAQEKAMKSTNDVNIIKQEKARFIGQEICRKRELTRITRI